MRTREPWIVFNNGLSLDVLPAMRSGFIALGIENKDDAWLIAAAPDLLAALRGMAELVQEKGMSYRWAAALSTAWAAIDKAEGRS